MKATLPEPAFVTRKGKPVSVIIPIKYYEELLERVKDTDDVRKYAAEQGIAEEEALKKGMEEKSREFSEKGSELYAKA